MNLHGIVAGAVAAVNPLVSLVVRVSTGSTVGADGTPTPTYANPVVVQGQVQPLQFRDIVQTDGLNLQGTRQSIYINGRIDGLIRADNKGGDLITDPDGNVWLVALMAEIWPDWCRAIVVLQDGS